MMTLFPQHTWPWTFHEVEVERDNALYLGLIAHEIAHLPDLKRLLAGMAQAREEAGGETLASLINLVEDIRIESVQRELPPVPEAFWEILMWLRFGNPHQALNYGWPYSLQSELWALARQEDDETVTVAGAARLEQLRHITDFWDGVHLILADALPEGVAGSVRAAREILALAREHRLEPPAATLPPVCFRPAAPADAGESAPDGDADEALFELRGRAPGSRDLELWAAPDEAALQAGLALGRRLTQWWTQGPAHALAGGVGQYNPRLEGRGLPPFTLPLLKQTAPPPRLALFLDVSGSMWDGGNGAIAPARQAAVAVAQAVKQAGGQVKLWAFCEHAIALGDDLRRLVSVLGGGTCLDFLEDLAPGLPPERWHYLFITDAQIGTVPAVWSAAYRKRSAVLYIATAEATAAPAVTQQLGQPVIAVTRSEDLPHLTALAARRFFAAAVRG